MKTKVLIIDDDASIRESIKRVLQGEDYEVFLAADGREAVDRYDAERVDLLLLDIELPQGNGWDIFERFITKNPSLPVIIITGHADQYGVATAAGANAFMEKPVDACKLLQTIRDLLDGPKQNRVGCGGRHRHVPPDAQKVFAHLRARYLATVRWGHPASALPSASTLREKKDLRTQNER